jgi:hypothetical protein
MIEVYTDGSKSPSGVGSGIAVFENKHLTFQLKYNGGEMLQQSGGATHNR